MEDRIQKAVELFKSGYNCSQSVVAAFADMYGFTQEQALRMGASFGGGIGRMRETGSFFFNPNNSPQISEPLRFLNSAASSCTTA